MDIINLILLSIIIFFLLYSYMNYRFKENSKKNIINKKNQEKNYEIYVITAVIAAMMDQKKYRIRKVIALEKEERYSAWRIIGRQEMMRKIMRK